MQTRLRTEKESECRHDDIHTERRTRYDSDTRVSEKTERRDIETEQQQKQQQQQ